MRTPAGYDYVFHHGAGGAAPRPMAEGPRSNQMHRVSCVHHGMQKRERGAGRCHPHLCEVGRRRDVPAGAPGVPGDTVQSVHRRAVCDRLPDRSDVQASRRHRRLRQGDLHRVQGLHGGLPLRRDLHQPRRPLGREVQHVRPPDRRGSRTGMRLGVSHWSDHRGRRQRPDIEGRATRGAPPRGRPKAGEGDGARRVLPRCPPGHP